MGNVTLIKQKENIKTSEKYNCDERIIKTSGNRAINVKIFKSIENNSQTSKSGLKLTEKVVMCIHGVAGSSYVWHKQIEYFTFFDYTVICMDLLGHGASHQLSSYDDYSFRKLSDDCLAIFDQFCNDNKTNIVVGHSYGCSMAAVVAHDRPALVSRLILISGGSAKPLGPPDKLFVYPLCCMECIHPIILYLFRKKTFHCAKESFGVKQLSINVDSFVLKATMLGQLWDEGDDMYHSQITAPTLLIHGNEDKIVSIDEEWDMKSAIPNCSLKTIEGAGHYSMLEAANQVNQLIRNHIERNCNLNTDVTKPTKMNRSNSEGRKMRSKNAIVYGKATKVTLRSANTFSEFHNEITTDEFDIAERKTLPSGLIMGRRSTIRRQKPRIDSGDESMPSTIVEDMAEASF